LKFLITYLCFFPFFLSGQVDNFNEHYKKAKEVFVKQNILVDASYHMYPSHDSQKLISTAQSKTYISSDLYNQSIEGVYTIIDKDQILVCDTNEEIIVRDKSKGEALKAIFNIDLDQLTDFIQSVEIDRNGEIITYQLQVQYSEVSQLDISINSRTNQFEKVILYFKYSESLGEDISESELPRLEVTFSPYKFDQKAKWTISNNPFIRLEGKEMSLGNQYKNYQFINNIQEP